MIPESTFATHHKFTVSTTNHTTVIYNFERMKNYLSEISKLDGTFYTVPTQFSQLCTVFVVIDRHALPGIHCSMTSKDQNSIQQYYQRSILSSQNSYSKSPFLTGNQHHEML